MARELESEMALGIQDGRSPTYETDDPVLYLVRDGVARITLNRPSFGNAQNGQMSYALDRVFARAGSDDAVRVVILSGEGRHFSAGHDIGSPGRDVGMPAAARATLWWDHSDKPGAEAAYVREQDVYLGLCKRWRTFPKPVVAAVRGACVAGGLALAWICDLIVASDTAYFADPVLRMGVPGIEYFTHAFEMHPRAAREFLFLGERMSAERAYQLGMVNRVVADDHLDAEVEAIAARLAQMPSFGLALAKQAFNQVEDLQGRSAAIDTAFGLHHLAHAHNQLTTGHATGGAKPADIAAALRGEANS